MVAAGDIVLASDMNDARSKVLYRANRTTSKTITSVASGTETPILRLDNCVLSAGKAYYVSCPGVRADSSDSNDLTGANIRYSTSGVATTSSPDRVAVSEQTDQRTMSLGGFLFPSSTATYSFLLTGRRAVGAGTATSVAFYGEPEYNLVVEYCGDAPADTGVDL